MPKKKATKGEKKITKPEEKKTPPKPSYYEAVGRKKEATARVRLYVAPPDSGGVTVGAVQIKAGEIIVNGKPIDKYFAGAVARKFYLEPLRTTNNLGRFAISAIIEGGGITGQIGAFILGVSRSLVKVDTQKYRPILKKRGFLTRDPRVKERRKAGLAQKARAQKQSPKR